MLPIEAVVSIFTNILGIVNKNVEDKDKKNEIVQQISTSQTELIKVLVQTQTVPWVDALVKLVYAFADTLDRIWRPVGGLLAACFVAYTTLKGIPVNPILDGVLAALFPGWMVSRHMVKVAEVKAQQPTVIVQNNPANWPKNLN